MRYRPLQTAAQDHAKEFRRIAMTMKNDHRHGNPAMGKSRTLTSAD